MDNLKEQICNRALNNIMEGRKSEFVKSPLNYTGGKYKLLKHLKSFIPSHIEGKFVDLFGGGYNVGPNFSANKYVYNDIDKNVVDILRNWYSTDTDELLAKIDGFVKRYDLSKTNAEGYNRIRSDYNGSGEKDPMMLYTILAHAFNNQIRFNGKGEYNMPFGKNKSCFNERLRKNFINYVNRLRSQNTEFYSGSYDSLPVELTQGDFVYVDPPYYNSTAAYNEKGGWTAEDEKKLLSYLDGLNAKGVKWLLSNNLKYDNPMLESWMTKYHVEHLGTMYGNCNYHKKDRTEDDEIVVMNY